ncbi:amino acid permease [Thermopolyspora flexuosa]|uniref:APA family basic amino acid/polyamine antiporter n=1 Tax=Thermopolyspora flexuosa TaxID=103836 RepID=A0A543IPV3_9ACTN|nr:amino acid permease [Thermopolyspora flexuosa]TQM72604.1 APA family basic amino acid/polyamine antiporter [Thermopolyspora flexuosa]GGM69284.1 amino acid permease [Thermopolyspora flexuosa]
MRRESTHPSTSLLRRLPASEATGKRTGARHRLVTIYHRRDLIVLGLGVMIGAGIFTIAGRQAASMAGPGVILSFMIAGICSLLAAFCYAELTSTIPASGSAYTFTYVIFGELWAWVIGWSLILEMMLAASVVARAWSLIFGRFLTDLNVAVPAPLAGVVGQVEGFDLPSLVILALLTGIVALGARFGLRTLWLIVCLKLIAIGGVIVFGVRHIDPANLAAIPAPEAPAPEEARDTLHTTIIGLLVGETDAFGWYGILAATPAIVFAYIGWDIVATAAEETIEPRRTMPEGMIRSLVLTTVIYIAVAVVMVGMVPYTRIDPETPLASAFRLVGDDFMVHVINIGGVLGLTTVILVLLVGQTRIVFSMARDGLLPRSLSRLSRWRSPSTATLVLGGCAMVLAQTVPVFALEQLVVIGTLFAFLFVAIGVIAMNRSMPDLPRGFRTPMQPFVPALSAATTLWLMLNLQVFTWLAFAVWMAAGLLIYLAYGRRHSMLAPGAYHEPPPEPRPRPEPWRRSPRGPGYGLGSDPGHGPGPGYGPDPGYGPGPGSGYGPGSGHGPGTPPGGGRSGPPPPRRPGRGRHRR